MSLVSFIIPAWNEEAVVGRTIDAIHAAASALGLSYEVVVADDDSTDRTAKIATERGARVVPVSNRQIAATRNAGAREARGGVFVFVDADTTINADAVRAALEAIDGGAVGGGCAFQFDGRVPLRGKVIQFVARHGYRLAKLASGCFLFCTREAFDAAGGFDTDLFAAEEAAMSLALRRQGRFAVLRESVVTSGRKLRTYSAWEMFVTLFRITLLGRRALRRRDGLDIWYGKRRSDDGRGSHVTNEIPRE